MRKIVVGCSPRTGSNLLCLSLATVPGAVTGGEWCNDRLPKTATPIGSCNLFKLYGDNYTHQDFAQIMDGAFLIYLYRDDQAGQEASFARACQTGRWLASDVDGWRPDEIPDIHPMIADARSRFFTPSDMQVSYEQLVADWDEVIKRIQHGAGWPECGVAQATLKL